MFESHHPDEEETRRRVIDKGTRALVLIWVRPASILDIGVGPIRMARPDLVSDEPRYTHPRGAQVSVIRPNDETS